MRKLENNLYSQSYLSDDFFGLIDVMDSEITRLMDLDVYVIDYNTGVTKRNGVTLFYLTLYFKSNSNKELKQKDLFTNYKNN